MPDAAYPAPVSLYRIARDDWMDDEESPGYAPDVIDRLCDEIEAIANDLTGATSDDTKGSYGSLVERLAALASELATAIQETGGTMSAPLLLADGSPAASEAYVQAIAAGQKWKEVAAASTTATKKLTGTWQYSNGTLGVGATLTRTLNGAMSAAEIDDVTPAVGKRILILHTPTLSGGPATAEAVLGLYTITTVGAAGSPTQLTRATDCDVSAEITSAAVYIEGGNLPNDGGNKGTTWVQTVSNPVMGTSALIWSKTGETVPLGGDATGPISNARITGLQGRSVASTAPGEGDYLRYVGGIWTPDDGTTQGGVVDKTGTTYTLALDDAASVLRFTSTSPISITIPADATVAFPIGHRQVLRRGGAGGASGAITITHASAGAVLSAAADWPQWGDVVLTKIAANTWVVTNPHGEPLEVRSISTPGTTAITLRDGAVLVDATSGDITLEYPASASLWPSRLRIKRTDASTNTVTITTAGAQQIDGLDTFVLTEPEQSVILRSTGTALIIEAEGQQAIEAHSDAKHAGSSRVSLWRGGAAHDVLHGRSGSTGAAVTIAEALSAEEYDGWLLAIVDGTGAGQQRMIVSTHGGAAGAASVTVESAFSPQPDATSLFNVVGGSITLAGARKNLIFDTDDLVSISLRDDPDNDAMRIFARLRAAPSMVVPMLAGASITSASVTPTHASAATATEMLTSGRLRAPADLRNARWIRLTIHNTSANTAGYWLVLRATTDGSTWTTLTDKDGNEIRAAVPTASGNFADTGKLELNEAHRALGICEISPFLYGPGSGTVTVTLVGIQAQVGVV